MIRRLISAFITAALVLGGIGAYFAVRDEKETYTVTADVEQAPNVFEGGRVMVRGVEVGEITNVSPAPDAVRITMEIEQGIKIPADARLAIVPITVIADRYVQFYPAYKTGPSLADGAHLDTSDTSIPAELDEVLAQLKGLLDSLAPKPGERRGPLTKLVIGLDEALDGRAEALAGTVEGSATVLENLADSESDITRLIANLDRLFAALANRSSEIGLINERFALVAEALAADQENIEGTIENLTLLSEESSLLVSESGENLGRSFARLGRVMHTILAHEESLEKGISWANVVAQALGETDASGRGRWAYTGRQAAPGTARASYNYRIETRDTIACERLRVLADNFITAFPGYTADQIRESVMSFIPPEYHDDLQFLIYDLLELCAVLPGENAAEQRPSAVVRETIQRMGRDRFLKLMGRWIADGLLRGAR
jgi:phospholipid/cholesterol/gamma-HCH transport system substrate-binding protein